MGFIMTRALPGYTRGADLLHQVFIGRLLHHPRLRELADEPVLETEANQDYVLSWNGLRLQMLRAINGRHFFMAAPQPINRAIQNLLFEDDRWTIAAVQVTIESAGAELMQGSEIMAARLDDQDNLVQAGYYRIERYGLTLIAGTPSLMGASGTRYFIHRVPNILKPGPAYDRSKVSVEPPAGNHFFGIPLVEEVYTNGVGWGAALTCMASEDGRDTRDAGGDEGDDSF